MYGYEYYTQGETGWDPNMPRTCPFCGGRSYSSAYLNSNCGGTAKCPHCGREF
jgi:transcription elongation factor Elf1